MGEGVGGGGGVVGRAPCRCRVNCSRAADTGLGECTEQGAGPRGCLCCIVVEAPQVLQTGPVAELVLVLQAGRMRTRSVSYIINRLYVEWRTRNHCVRLRPKQKGIELGKQTSGFYLHFKGKAKRKTTCFEYIWVT